MSNVRVGHSSGQSDGSRRLGACILVWATLVGYQNGWLAGDDELDTKLYLSSNL